jgi:hypothetical protein
VTIHNGDDVWHVSRVPGPPPDAQSWGGCLLFAGAGHIELSAARLAIQAAVERRCDWIAVVAANAEEIHDRTLEGHRIFVWSAEEGVVEARLRALGLQ